MTCLRCGGYGYHAGHGCDGTEQGCQSTCPIPIMCELCAGEGGSMSAIYEARILEAIVSGREGLFHTSAHFHAAVYQIARMVAVLVEDASGNALLAAEAYGAAGEEGVMSAHDDAMRVVTHDFSPHDPWELEQIVKAYLSDLPPSIVVDGKVVGLAEVYAKYDNQSECVGIAIADARRAIAARQVARREA